MDINSVVMRSGVNVERLRLIAVNVAQILVQKWVTPNKQQQQQQQQRKLQQNKQKQIKTQQTKNPETTRATTTTTKTKTQK